MARKDCRDTCQHSDIALKMVGPYAPTDAAADSDPRMWLEEVEAEKCLDWVRARNAAALSALGKPEESETYKRVLAILDSKEKIAYVGRVLNGYATAAR